MSTQEAGTAVVDVESENRKSQLVYLRSFLGITFWAYALIHLFIFDIDNALSFLVPSISAALFYKSIILGFAIFILWATLGHKQFFITVGYVIAYPAIFLWQFLSSIHRLLKKKPKVYSATWECLILLSLNVAASFEYLRIRLFSLFIFASSIAITISSNNRTLLIAALSSAVAYITLHYALKIITAFQLRLPMLNLKERVDKNSTADSYRKQIKKVKDGVGKAEVLLNSTEIGKKLTDIMYQAYDMLALLAKADEYVTKLKSNAKLTGLFSFSFLYTVVVAIFSFSIIYFNLYKLNPSSFSSDGSLQYWDLLYYSSSIMLQTPQLISPNSTWAIILTSLEGFVALLTLVLVFYIFTSVVKRAYSESIETMSSIIGTQRKQIKKLLAKEYKKSPKTIEKELETHTWSRKTS